MENFVLLWRHRKRSSSSPQTLMTPSQDLSSCSWRPDRALESSRHSSQAAQEPEHHRDDQDHVKIDHLDVLFACSASLVNSVLEDPPGSQVWCGVVPGRVEVVGEVLQGPLIQTLRKRVNRVQLIEGGVIEAASLPTVIIIIIINIIITLIIITFDPAQTRGGMGRTWTRSRDNQPQWGPRQTDSQSGLELELELKLF